MNRLDKVRALFLEKFGEPAQFFVRSPGRVNLLGEHTDYNLGFVLPMAIEQGTFLGVRPRQDHQLRVYSSSLDSWLEIDLSMPVLKGKKGHWGNYVKGVASVLQSLTDKALEGMDVAIFSDLPIGASLSSSASLELAFARALWTQIGKPWDSVLAARLCQRAEHEFAEVACGIMDQLACSAASEGHAMMLDCREMQFRDVPLPKDLMVAIMDSGTRRSLSDGRYNRRRAECEQAAMILGLSCLRDLRQNHLQEQKGVLSIEQYNRALHVIEENERVKQAFLAMKNGEIGQLGRIMNEGHQSLKELFHVSTAELDWLVDIARAQKGCFGARITGAGFGGCAVAILHRETKEEFSERVSKIYLERTGKTGAIFFSTAQAGCTIV